MKHYQRIEVIHSSPGLIHPPGTRLLVPPRAAQCAINRGDARAIPLHEVSPSNKAVDPRVARQRAPSPAPSPEPEAGAEGKPKRKRRKPKA